MKGGQKVGLTLLLLLWYVVRVDDVLSVVWGWDG